MPEADVSAVCKLECATDADCANLGLKKPVCAIYTCTGQRICADNPF